MIKDKLVKIRKSKGWTQNDLAERSGYSRSSIINWETGKRAPRTVDIERLAIVLGVSPSDFLDNINSSNTQENLQTTTEPNQDNRGNSVAFWGEVLDRARNLAKSKDIREIKLITPLLQSALNVLLSVQGHREHKEDVISNVAVYSGSNSNYSGNTLTVGA